MFCTICGSGKIIESFNIGESVLYKCNNCEVEFLHPQPSAKKLKDIYEKEYYNSWGLNDKSFSITREMKYSTGIKHLKEIHNIQSSGMLLDIGCAFGFFLEAARNKGFDAYGVEFSSYSSAFAKKSIGDERIYNGILEESPFTNELFNVITMFDLIEHAPSPKETLRKAAQMLAPKGIIVLSTPNSGSFSRFLMKKKWIHYKEEHLFYFNKKSIKFLADELNLHVVKAKAFKKVFYLSYVLHQFEIYKHIFLTPVFRILNNILPKFFLKKPFSLSIGEMFVVLRKAS